MEAPNEKVTARRFISTGRMGKASEADVTGACIREILAVSRTSLKQALGLARKFSQMARGHGKPMQLMSYRILGQVSHQSGLHRQALTAYLRAITLARGDPPTRASIQRMLIDVYMYLGKYVEARRAAAHALATFKRLGREADWHQTQVNYANLLHRQDRHRDAARLYSDAAAFFERTENTVAAARCLYNLGNTSVQLFDVDNAENQYARARELFERSGYELGACNVRYGQAWLAMLKGNFHSALVELKACEEIYRAAGDPRGEALCILDCAEVDLALGLYSDASRDARRSERQFRRLGLRYESAKSALFQSQAALHLGLFSQARAARRRASSGFIRESNQAFQGVTELLAADLLVNASQREGMLRKARAHFRLSQLRLWEAVCDLRSATVGEQVDSALSRLKSNSAVQTVPHLYSSYKTLLGDRCADDGRLDEAKHFWAEAAEKIDSVRSQLPPVELRNSFTQKLPSPHRRLIRAERRRSPRLAAIWSERLSTAGLWSPVHPVFSTQPARMRVRNSLHELSNQIAFLMHHMAGVSGERGVSSERARQIVARLQSQIRDEFMAMEQVHSNGSDSVEFLDSLIAKLSDSSPIVQFHVGTESITAFVHFAGKTTAHYIEDGRVRLESALERWRFLLERQLWSAQAEADFSPNTESALWTEIGDWLWKPLGIPADAPSVVIIPEGELANLPWNAIGVDDVSLMERHTITLAPSLRHCAAAQEVKTDSIGVEVFRGAGLDLQNADSELQLLTEAAPAHTVVHNPAKRDDWPDSSDDFLWHFVGHAVMNEENPFYSFLAMADGPMFAADFRLRKCRVNLVTLAACRTAEQAALPGEESTGLVRSLLEMGARNVIAGHWPVSDESTSLWMTTFYKRYLGGEPLHRATRTAALAVRDRYPSAFHWSAFSIHGAGPTGEKYASN